MIFEFFKHYCVKLNSVLVLQLVLTFKSKLILIWINWKYVSLGLKKKIPCKKCQLYNAPKFIAQ